MRKNDEWQHRRRRRLRQQQQRFNTEYNWRMAMWQSTFNNSKVTRDHENQWIRVGCDAAYIALREQSIYFKVVPFSFHFSIYFVRFFFYVFIYFASITQKFLMDVNKHRITIRCCTFINFISWLVSWCTSTFERTTYSFIQSIPRLLAPSLSVLLVLIWNAVVFFSLFFPFIFWLNYYHTAVPYKKLNAVALRRLWVGRSLASTASSMHLFLFVSASKYQTCAL